MMRPTRSDSATHDIPLLEDDALVIPLDVLERIRRLFEFLRRLEEQRSPVRRDVEAAEWSLFLSDVPPAPCVRARGAESAREVDAREVLALQRPELTACPRPPPGMDAHLRPDWEDPAQPEPLLATWTASLDARAQKAVQSWLSARAKWAEAEQPSRTAAELFDRALALWARLQREGERFRLLLGEGHLLWQRADGLVRHPLLLQEVELRFDEARRELVFVDSGAVPFLYSDLLATLPELDGEKRRAMRAIVDDALEKGSLGMLEGPGTEPVLRALAGLLSAPAAPLPPGSSEAATQTPRLARDAVLLLVPRTQGLAAVYEGFLQRLHQLPALPRGLALVVGDTAAIPSKKAPEPPLFFTKPANEAQKRIAQRIEETGAVLVQGPPGTGKTHTIANLIGHFLAHGKTVLVTAQTSRALRVVRDQVVEPLKPLCVSVLDSDVDSRDELESSVNTIVAKLNFSAQEYEREAAARQEEGRELVQRLRQKESRFREALKGEVEELKVGALSLHPTEAALRVSEGKGTHDWILGPLSPNAKLPLSDEELKTLYALNAELTLKDELELKAGVPSPQELLPAEEVERIKKALDAALPTDPGRWPAPWGEAPIEKVSEVAERLKQLTVWVERQPQWARACIQGILQGGAHAEPWEELLAQMEGTGPKVALLQKTVLPYDVKLEPRVDPDEELPVAQEMLAHLTEGGGLGFFTRAGKASWRRLLDRCTVKGRRAESEQEVRAIEGALTLEQLRRQLRRTWDVVLTPAGLPLEEKDRARVEEVALARAPEVRRAVRWASTEYAEVMGALSAIGVPWSTLLETTPSKPPFAELQRIVNCARGRVLPGMELEVELSRRMALETKLRAGRERLARYVRCLAAERALSALLALDLPRYREALEGLGRLWALRGKAQLRERLVDRLWAAAPAWAERIRARLAPHQGPELPGDVRAAWANRVLSEELDRRQAEDVDLLGREITELSERLREVIGLIVENRAWAAQARRTDPQQHRALMSWLDMMKRLGKGYSKRANEFRASARKQLELARNTVPVWIMPLSRVAESFGPDQKLFDVVILDEASQCDVSALVAFALGQKVVVVGDDEQVSPSAIGEGVEDVRELQREWLEGFPDKDLFDGRASAYELARRSFPGGLIRLTEHFRCVPDIISFCNALCYEGEVQPLREPSSARVYPAVLSHRVADGERISGEKVNRREALELASLVVSVTEQKEYAGLELGVISLLGQEQAKEIDLLLQRFLDPATYKERRLISGTAPHFQGDERDVMFLSLVDSGGDGGPLRLLDRDEMKKRYNVAVSRAREQLWVVHSLDAERHLKADDLRRKLLEHAEKVMAAPSAALAVAGAAGGEGTTPELVRRVREALVQKGYRVEPSVGVGNYRLHLVVSGEGGRVAIQCDGAQRTVVELDRELQAEAVLQRLGWRFVRIRGSVFCRAPEVELGQLTRRLGELGIAPGARGVAGTSARAPDAALVERVRTRAAALRREWLEQAGSLNALFRGTGAGGGAKAGQKARWKASGAGTKAKSDFALASEAATQLVSVETGAPLAPAAEEEPVTERDLRSLGPPRPRR